MHYNAAGKCGLWISICLFTGVMVGFMTGSYNKKDYKKLTALFT